MLFLRGEQSPARSAGAALGIRGLDLAGPHTAASRASGSGNAPAPDPDAVALMLHTSGTTSRPKGVPIRQRNLVASVRDDRRPPTDSRPDDAGHCVMPLFHVHGLVGVDARAAVRRRRRRWCRARFSASAFWAAPRPTASTWFFGRATIHQSCLARAGATTPRPGSGCRFVRSCCAALPPPLLAHSRPTSTCPLLEAYGMTEASHQMTSNPLPPGPAARLRGLRQRRATWRSWTRPATCSRTGAPGRGGRARPGRRRRLPRQPRGQRGRVRGRLVPHRRPGRPRRRLPHAGRAASRN